MAELASATSENRTVREVRRQLPAGKPKPGAHSRTTRTPEELAQIAERVLVAIRDQQPAAFGGITRTLADLPADAVKRMLRQLEKRGHVRRTSSGAGTRYHLTSRPAQTPEPARAPEPEREKHEAKPTPKRQATPAPKHEAPPRETTELRQHVAVHDGPQPGAPCRCPKPRRGAGDDTCWLCGREIEEATA